MARVSVGREEDVARFQVAVDYLMVVEIGDTVEDSEQNADRGLKMKAVSQWRRRCRWDLLLRQEICERHWVHGHLHVDGELRA